MIFKAQTEWVKPTEFPDLRHAEEIAIDLETYDPDLKKLGTGSVIGRGKVVGIAVATDGYSRYFPFAACLHIYFIADPSAKGNLFLFINSLGCTTIDL